jgi:HEAT repeat protein
VSFLFPSPTITFEAALRDLARGTDRARCAAAHALGDAAGPDERPAAVAALIAGLRDDIAQVRAEAAASLGALGDAAATAALVARLGDGDAAVRQAAAIALGSIGGADAFAPLAAALKDGPADLRFQAATSLVEVDAARAYDPLVAALDDRDPQVLAAIALALGAIGDGRAAGHLVRLVEHGDPGVRFDAAYGLAQLGDGRGRAQLAAALGDGERGWDAACGLEKLGQPADADALAGALGGKGVAPHVRLRVAGAVLRIAPDHRTAADARRVLTDGLRLRKLELRGLAVEQLGGVGGDWAAEALAQLRRSRRGRDLIDEIEAALAAIRTRTPDRTRP